MMTQLYVGNLSEDGDEKNIRTLFGKYGIVREVLVKNGYAFVEMDTPLQADHAIRELNGSEILGHPMIVEPSHQQRLSSRRRSQLGVVDVSNIPPHMTLEAIENFFSKTIGPVVKIEIEDNRPSDFGAKRILVSFESYEPAQRAAAIYTGEDNTLKCTLVEELSRPGSAGMRNGRKSSPNSPSKGNNEFPLRILVPSDMVGAIIGKDGATIRNITTLTKARVDVHRRENLGSVEKAITIIGTPEACTEACYQIMKIMQNELLTTSGIFENTKHHFEPLPVVPLKILAHNELVGRVIGKGGNTLKRIMAESGTKITISKLKDLTAYNMERTITILGTIDNCKKAESLISAKLRASYESDMNQFMQNTDQSGSANSSSPTLSHTDMLAKPTTHPQSLPTTPTAVRTFHDFTQEHTRLTTLHGSTGALEVNGLGGFYQPLKAGGMGAGMVHLGPGYGAPYDPTLNGFHKPHPTEYGMKGNVSHGSGGGRPCPIYGEDDVSDVFHGLSLKDPIGMAPTSHIYGRGMGSRLRRSSAPVQPGNPAQWGPDMTPGDGGHFEGVPAGHAPSQHPSHHSQNGFMGTWVGQPNNGHAYPTVQNADGSVSSIWSPTFASRPESELSSYHDSDGSQSVNGFSPIISPTPVTSAFFDASSSSSGNGTAAVSTVQSSTPSSGLTSISETLVKHSGPSHMDHFHPINAQQQLANRVATVPTYRDDEEYFSVHSAALEQLINEQQPMVSAGIAGPW